MLWVSCSRVCWQHAFFSGGGADSGVRGGAAVSHRSIRVPPERTRVLATLEVQMPLLILTLLVLLVVPLSAVAQDSVASRRIPRRIATLTAGVGNVMGWLGLHGEKYFARERFSGFVGLGYTPA